MIERSRVRVPVGTSEEFSSPWSPFCADSYFGIRSTPTLPQEHVKDAGHSAKSAGGRLQTNTHEHAETAAVLRDTSHVAYAKMRYKKLVTHLESRVARAQWLCTRAENSAI